MDDQDKPLDKLVFRLDWKEKGDPVPVEVVEGEEAPEPVDLVPVPVHSLYFDSLQNTDAILAFADKVRELNTTPDNLGASVRLTRMADPIISNPLLLNHWEKTFNNLEFVAGEAKLETVLQATS